MLAAYSGTLRKPIDRAEHRKHGDNQGAGTAHSSSGRKIAGQRNVRAVHCAREVARHPPRDHGWIDRPAVTWDLADRATIANSKFCRRMRSLIRTSESAAGNSGNAEATFCRAQQTASAAVVGVLAQHLDSSGHKPAHGV